MALSLTPQDLDLPAKFKDWKGQQEEVIERIVNSQKKVFLLDAPTGSGKSVIGVAASYIWRTNWLTTRALQGEDGVEELPKRVIYVTRTKQLQEQLLCDFSNSRTIKGRVNYPCLLAPAKFPDFNAEDCPHHGKDNPCPFKTSCPYLLAKYEALHADIAILNESYYLSEINGPGQFSRADMVILDEVDSLEQTLMSHISVDVMYQTLNDLAIAPPADWEDWRSWLEWWNQTNTKREHQVGVLQSQVDIFGDKWTDKEIKANKHLSKLVNFNRNMDTFMQEILQQVASGGDSMARGSGFMPLSDAIKITISGKETPFVVQEKKDRTNRVTGWELKPVTIRGFTLERLWRHAERFLGMSGTILSPVVQAREIGITEAQYEYFQIPSPFDIKNRPVYYWPVANMRQQSIASGEALPKIISAINRILDKYPNQKGLIHTASYQISTAIQHGYEQGIGMGNAYRIIGHDTNTRTNQLEAFKKAKEPLVMVSPSFDRGVDLPGDLCRFIVICKVPYLNLGDKQISARLKAPGGDQWYVFKAIQTIMQMSGRGVRNEEDFCDTYILDMQFMSLLARVKQYIPAWWMESIRRIEDL